VPEQAVISNPVSTNPSRRVKTVIVSSLLVFRVSLVYFKHIKDPNKYKNHLAAREMVLVSSLCPQQSLETQINKTFYF